MTDTVTASIVKIGPQRVGRPFPVTMRFVFRSPDWNNHLEYVDDTWNPHLVPPNAIRPAVNQVVFMHPGLPAGTQTVTIQTSGPPATSVTSNPFIVR